ncbi:hypothetical protein Q1695_009921 [Nippostrongylus brasiliensis]|nr:hypothetical protein Q1695_009921 [Nippostrongylus brasiliensis]
MACRVLISKGCRHHLSIIIFLFVVIIVQFYNSLFTVTEQGLFVAIESNGGQIGNQLFHLCSGHGIARKLGRRQYIRTLNSEGFYIGEHLKKIETIFPRLVNAYSVLKVWNEHRVPFAQRNGHISCCEYEDPVRLMNRTEQFLVLDFHYAQNVRYFEYMISEIRQLLEFSPSVAEEGKEVLQRLAMSNGEAMCAHIRRTDFVDLNVASDFHSSVDDIVSIASQQNLSKFLIFGDDADFMRRMTDNIDSRLNTIGKTRALFSRHWEGIDFYLASQACGAILITAPTSTFGWWLAFFVQNQNAVFYSRDLRRMGDKIPQKDMFL